MRRQIVFDISEVLLMRALPQRGHLACEQTRFEFKDRAFGCGRGDRTRWFAVLFFVGR